MTTVAATITQAIQVCADNIGELSYTGVVVIKTRMNAWLLALYGAGGIFTDVESAGQRRVIDWRGPANLANAAIEAAVPGGCGLFGTSAVIDSVLRVLCAIRDAAIALAITAGQQTAALAAFNLQWT